MNTEAIERIRGYCCEVTQAQWDELVRVADEVGVKVYAHTEYNNVTQSYHKIASVENGLNRIPFLEYLAKLKGEEQWQPKAGEMVEVGGGYVREYIATRGGKHFCWGERGDTVSTWPTVKQIRPTITRTEAEAILNKRIID